MLEEFELVHHKHLESRLNWLYSAIMSLPKRLAGKGTRQDIEYEEELVHNAPAIASNAVISVAKKVEDNVLQMMTALVAALQPTMP